MVYFKIYCYPIQRRLITIYYIMRLPPASRSSDRRLSGTKKGTGTIAVQRPTPAHSPQLFMFLIISLLNLSILSHSLKHDGRRMLKDIFKLRTTPQINRFAAQHALFAAAVTVMNISANFRLSGAFQIYAPASPPATVQTTPAGISEAGTSKLKDVSSANTTQDGYTDRLTPSRAPS